MFHVKHFTPLAGADLVVGYPRRDVVRIDTLRFEAGEVTALIGPNAAGKSTLIRCLAGALPPRSGTVTLNGSSIYRISARTRAQGLAYVSQQSGDQFAFTVEELVRLGASANPHAPGSDDERVRRALDRMDLAALARRDLARLSGGEQQRAAIARALAQSTPVLLLDEPAAHLDLRHQAALMEAVRAAAREGGATVLIVLHDLNLAGAYADRLLLMNGGRIVADGPPRAVLDNPALGAAYQTDVLTLRDEAGNPYIHVAPHRLSVS